MGETLSRDTGLRLFTREIIASARLLCYIQDDWQSLYADIARVTDWVTGLLR